MQMTRQLETIPITPEKLVGEVKAMYADLVEAEAKCIDSNAEWATATQPPLDNNGWQALIALHRTLLMKNYDFITTSQNPSARAAVRGLAAKYFMPHRMWGHGIHSLLEQLRLRLPGTLGHMLTFIYFASGMMALRKSGAASFCPNLYQLY